MSGDSERTSSSSPLENEHVGKTFHGVMNLALHKFSSVKNESTRHQSFLRNEDVGMKNDKSQWRMIVVPTKELEPNIALRRKSLSVYFTLESPVDIKVSASCSASIVNETGEILQPKVEKSKTKIFDVKAGGSLTWGWCHFIDHENLGKPSRYIINDTLRIQGRITFKVISGGQQTRTPAFVRTPSAELLWNMFEMKTGSDFMLIASDDQEFPVHKFQLSLYSEVFATMFEHDLEEVKSGTYSTGDIDGETIAAMLRFIYGKNDWKAELAEKLLVAARKYQIKSLEKDCIGVLGRLLSMENAAAFLQLADRHSLEELKKQVLVYIGADVEEFHAVGGFIELGKSPDLMREVLDFVQERTSKKLKRERSTTPPPSISKLSCI